MVLKKSMTVSHAPMYYWGEGGLYGPFDIQTDGEWAGWPDFGQVTRYFRKKAKLSAKAFGVLYGQAINKDSHAICERWILEMELENKVPVDITKRKTIARLLKVPPMLFGLAVLEEITLEPPAPLTQTVATATGHTHVPRVAVDITKYQNDVRTIWHMHDTSNAQAALGHLLADIRDLENYERQTQGNLRYQIQEALLGNQLLATHIVCDQRQFKLAYVHANEAVRVAKSMNDSDMIATALYTRGWTRLEWGLFGTMQQGVFQPQQDILSAAIRDFQAALQVFPGRDGKDAMHPQLLGGLTVLLRDAQAALAISKGECISASVLVALDDVADTVGRQNIHDPYMRALVTGKRRSWHLARYLKTRADVFLTAGLPGQALQELNTLERLTEKTYSRDETRQLAWLDIMKANIFIKLGEFGPAAEHATRALLVVRDINSITSIALITDIYGRLLTSSYKTSSDVRELGDILKKSSVVSVASEK